MDQEATGGLRRKLTGHDLAEVHDELERLDYDVSDEKRPKRLAGRVACHPIDHAETDQCRAHVARKDDRLRRHGKPESGEHRGGEDEKQDAEDHRGDAADHQGEARAHGWQAVHARQTTRVGYDPFARGPFGVGVRSGQIRDARRGGRSLPYEIWYPAAVHAANEDVFTVPPSGEELRQEAARDAAPRPGRFTLVLYSHASGGHRRQSSFLCTHLASHGYVVGAVDHTGNTAIDFAEEMRRRAEGRVPTEAEAQASLDRVIGDRVPDLRFLCDELLGGAVGEISPLIDPERIGLVGWSFGAWAVLATPEADDRFAAVVALAPAGSSKPLPGIIPATLTFAWKRHAATLILAAEQDRFIPLDGVVEIFDRIPSAKRMCVLGGADHQHFADRVDPEGACTREDAHLFTRALMLAHFEEHLKNRSAATDFFTRASDELRARGIESSLVGEPSERPRRTP